MQDRETELKKVIVPTDYPKELKRQSSLKPEARGRAKNLELPGSKTGGLRAGSANSGNSANSNNPGKKTFLKKGQGSNSPNRATMRKLAFK